MSNKTCPDLKAEMEELSIGDHSDAATTISSSFPNKNDEMVLSFDPTKKKKKDKKSGTTSIVSSSVTNHQPADGEPYYTYEELLKRAFAQLREQNPNDDGPNASRRYAFMPKAPSLGLIGTKRTCITNFPEISDSLNRQPTHLQAFFKAELGTTGSFDQNGCLIIKGRFQQAQIETVLRKYIKEYVTCRTCRRHETILEKEDRLLFVQCENCLSRHSVASIKTGFQAQVGKRAAVRH